jgi:hypothetical protein
MEAEMDDLTFTVRHKRRDYGPFKTLREARQCAEALGAREINSSRDVSLAEWHDLDREARCADISSANMH